MIKSFIFEQNDALKKILFQGVMMSHDNLTWTAKTAVLYLNVSKDDKLVRKMLQLHSKFIKWDSIP